MWIKDKIESVYKYGYVMVFALILVSPFFVKCFDLDFSSTIVEKRKLVEKPLFSTSKNYPVEFEKYYNDNFGLRSYFVNWNSTLKLELFNVSPKPEKVILGKNGYLFSNSKRQGEFYDSYSNTNLFDKQKLDRTFRVQRWVKNTLAEKNIEYVLCFFPNKHTVYKEYLPTSMKMQIVGDSSLADQLVDYFGIQKFPIVDLRQEMIKAGKKQQLYSKFDTHWNKNGAFLAYRLFCQKTFDQLHLIPFDESDFFVKYNKNSSGDLTDLMGVEKMKHYSEENPVFSLKDESLNYAKLRTDGYPSKTVVTLNENCGNNLTALVYHDSYSKAIIQFLSLHYQKVIYVRGSSVDMELVNTLKPNVVLNLIVERKLIRL